MSIRGARANARLAVCPGTDSGILVQGALQGAQGAQAAGSHACRVRHESANVCDVRCATTVGI